MTKINCKNIHEHLAKYLREWRNNTKLLIKQHLGAFNSLNEGPFFSVSGCDGFAS